jgi:hypothetical protein
MFRGAGLIRFVTDRRKYRHEPNDVSRMVGDSGRVVTQRRQGRGRSVEIAAAQTEKTAATQATHAGRKAGQAAGASRAVEVFNRTNEKRTTVMVARIDCRLSMSN